MSSVFFSICCCNFNVDPEDGLALDFDIASDFLSDPLIVLMLRDVMKVRTLGFGDSLASTD